jgi:hypothetical protein
LRSLLLLAGLLVAADSLAAQGTLEVQAQGVATITAREFAGGGLGAAYRTGGRTRVGLLVSLGSSHQDDGSWAFAGRGEALVSYHLNPYKRRGFTPYAGGGISLTLNQQDNTQYLLLVLGVESNPGGRTGVFADVGIAGGLRLSVGFQVRPGRR